jgi:hypothetical protein
MQLWRGRGSKTESMLRAARPAAPDDLVQRLVAEVTPMRRPQAPRFALAGVATAVMLVGLAAVGGVGHAANELRHVANIATGHTHTFGKHLTVQMDQQSAARAQYSPPTTQTSTGTQATIPPNTASTIPVGDSSVTLTSSSTVKATVSNTLPSSVTSTATISSGSSANQFVSVSLTDSSGNAIATLVVPMSVSISLTQTTTGSSSGGLPMNYAVTFSTDGSNFQSIPECTGGALSSGQTACYVLASSNDVQSGAHTTAGPTVQILSIKPGIFGVVYKANISTSETGKTVPQAGSGKFGDPTRNHVGGPTLKQVGSTITPQTTSNSTKVPFSFWVDEQAAVYISIYDSKGNPVWINTTGTTVRAHPYTGKTVHAFHTVILRPGLIKTMLKVPAGTLKPGQTYKIRITAEDFDGHKVTEFTTFTA